MTNNNKNIIYRILLFRLNLKLLPFFVSCGILLCSLLGYLGQYAWFFDLFSHFQVQYLLTSFACGLTLILFAIFAKNNTPQQDNNTEEKTKKTYNSAINKKSLFLLAILSFLIGIINIAQITPLYFLDNANSEHAKNLRLMHINVFTANSRYQDVQKYILQEDPDILLLEEVNEIWIKNLPTIFKKYPYKTLCPQSDNFGIAMFSKFKPIKSTTFFYGQFDLPYIKSEFQINAKKITVFGIHTIPPIGKNRWLERNKMLADIAKWSRNSNNSSTIILGDLNITPWSYFFKQMLKDGNLRNSQQGFGVQASWPTSPFLLRIPLDHCLVSKDIKVINRSIGPNVGSDHFPIKIDITMP